MSNNLFQSNNTPSYNSFKGVSNLTKLGSTSKTNKIFRNAQMMQCIEDCFMSIAFKSSRGENQRNERIAKRK